MTLLLGAALPFAALPAQAVTVDLYDWAVNVDTTVADALDGDPIPAGVNTGGLNLTTGFGQLRLTVNGAGAHYVGAFFDHEIDQGDNTWFNEIGAQSGAAAPGQTWEIDEPGWKTGDIFENLQAGALDDGNGTSIYGDATWPDDVSMAMAWDFNLAVGETGIVDFMISDLQPSPGGGLVLSQTDPDSNDYTLYLTSTLLKKPAGGGPSIPEPATVALFGLGLAAMAAAGGRRRRS